MKECIVILGMHRSGTSVLSGLVSHHGYYLGSNEMPNREDNPKGFFENFKIYQLNQSILLDHNTSWDEYSFTMDQISSDNLDRYEKKAQKIIKEEFGPVKRIFMKDPRMCLLFPLWAKVLNNMGFHIKVILAYRSPMEVAHSLKLRNDLVFEKILLMWTHHFFQAEKSSRNFMRMLVCYDKDIQNLDTFVSKLSDFLGTNLNDNIISSAHDLYTPQLKHHQLRMDNLSDDIPLYFKSFISILKSGDLNDSEKLDELMNEFYNSKNFYLYDELNLHSKIKSLKEELKKVKHLLEKEENEVKFLVHEVGQQKIRIDNKKNRYKVLKKEFGRTKEVIEDIVKTKDNEIKNLDSMIRERNEKIGRIIKGDSYFNNGQIFSFFKKHIKLFLSDKFTIIESGLFSSFYYLSQNPDVREARVDPLNHFCTYGWKEGRNPSPLFNCSKYLNVNKDVA